MSEDEKRALKAAVLLELEDAREDLCLLRAKAGIWSEAFQRIARVLALAERERDAQERELMNRRLEILDFLRRNDDLFDAAAVIDLDSRLAAAVLRLRKAETAKREMFGN